MGSGRLRTSPWGALRAPQSEPCCRGRTASCDLGAGIHQGAEEGRVPPLSGSDRGRRLWFDGFWKPHGPIHTSSPEHLTGEAGPAAPSPASWVLARLGVRGTQAASSVPSEEPASLRAHRPGPAAPGGAAPTPISQGTAVCADRGRSASPSSIRLGWAGPQNSGRRSRPGNPPAAPSLPLTLLLLLFPSRKGPASPTRPAVPRPPEAPLLDL